MNTKGSQHLKIEERRTILEKLDENCTCKEIAEIISKDERTISREVKNRRTRQENKRYGLYGKFDDEVCKRIVRYPFVCNGCNKRKLCFKKFKYFYEPDVAQDNYKIILSDSRIGLDCTLEDKAKFDSILAEGIKNGQSIHHIVATNKNELRYSERSAYRLVDKRQTIVQAIDLRRKVKLKPRKHYAYKEDNRAIRTGRTYLDYIRFLAENPTIMPVQIDTVEGPAKYAQKCLLTIHFTFARFMLIFLLDSKTKENVNAVFRYLKALLGNDVYKKIFPVVLTDRGTEFCSPEAIELDEITGELLTRLFYCDSYSSFQKGAIEENHELIRCIIPKGVAFDDLTQDKADLMVSHINSYHRKVIDATPYSVAAAFWGTNLINAFNCSLISANDVLLTPKLIR